MSLESDLYTILVGVTPRVFPDYAPVNTVRPYVTFQQIGGQAINFVDRLIPNKRNAEIQVNVWASTRQETLTLIQAIEDAIRMSTAVQGEPLSAPIMDFDADVPVYGAMQDFTIWDDR
jgi:hypothetical protein